VSHRLLIRLLLCIFISAFLLYSYIDKLNDITELKIEIPKLAEEVQVLREENSALSLQIEELENPKSLIQKMRQPEFSHLHQPTHVIKIEDW